MSEYRLDSTTFTKKMRDEAFGMAKWLRDDYAEHNEKVGKQKITYEFEEYREMLGVKKPDGGVVYGGKDAKFGDTFYECVLKITFPLKYLPFKAVDVHTYRWNTKHQEWEHESTEIL